MLSFSIDRGGTFTDTLCYNKVTGEEKLIKVLSVNPAAYSDAPIECIRLGLEWGLGRKFARHVPLPTDAIAEVRIGTTVATNALLERKGARFALVTTRGFRDLLFIGNQTRPDLFDLSCASPGVLYEDVAELDERVLLDDDNGPIRTPSGQRVAVRRAPTDAHIREQLQRLLDAGIRGLAVCLLHSAVYNAHELQVGRVALGMGFTNVSLSHVAGSNMIRAVPRGHSACADAYLTPVIREFVASFMRGFADSRVRVLFMRSDGGLESAASFSGHRAVLSGPAAGVVGVGRSGGGLLC
jgi:5-oxoprolinase (ATP-hydrolysing)